MQNYMKIDDFHLQTSFGIFGGVTDYQCYPQGELASIRLSERNMVVTEAGELVPAYSETPRRKNIPSVEFDRSGLVNTVALEEQQEIQTPIGELPVEKVKFYDTGELHRVFILDGQISGFWTEEEERELNIPLSFDLGFCTFQAMINSLCFYKDGAIKSITLFPGESVSIHTSVGEVETSVGLSLFPDGKLESIEPQYPVLLDTLIGRMTAFDSEQIGLNADSNSLVFYEDGRVKELTTCDDYIYVQTESGEMKKCAPKIIPHPLYDDVLSVRGMKILFDYDREEILIDGTVFSSKECGFTVETFQRPDSHCSPADCASCSLCNK
jgi:hypothetical protein